MAQGDKEISCLARIKGYVFPGVTNPTADDADDSLLHSSVFGFTLEDWRVFCSVLAAANPNNDPSKFPDFKSGNSILEHFEISATQEGKKGSGFKREHEPFLESLRKEVDAAIASDEARAFERTFSYPNQGHSFLLDSLKRNLSSHLKSLETYATSHKVAMAVFVIEHQEHGIVMVENIYSEVGEGCIFGDIRSQQKFDNYRLSRDREALKLLYNSVDTIDTVIFAGVGHLEFIKLSEIPNMLKLMPWPFVVAAGSTLERHSFLPALQVADVTKG